MRKAIGSTMVGDSTDSVWGVMDVYPRTNFPDIRKKATIHSDFGSLLLIPREGGFMVRFYIELPPGTAAKEVTVEDLHRSVENIFQPYALEIVETAWWSAYVIGQRQASTFSLNDRVFLTGDACHTHSPKAGQGMNISLQDGDNIGWKLGAVLTGQASPSLLQTYILEREKVAAELINFDREFAKLFLSRHGTKKTANRRDFSEYFVKAGRYTAGLATQYEDSTITSKALSKPELAKDIHVGMRIPTAQVVRFCDARVLQLASVMPADCRWRIVVFAGDIRNPRSAMRLQSVCCTVLTLLVHLLNVLQLGQYIDSHEGLLGKYRSKMSSDPFIDVLVVLHGKRIGIEPEQIPQQFIPEVGLWKIRGIIRIFLLE